MKSIRNVSSSSFWRNDEQDEKLKSFMTKRQADSYNLYKLAANKRAISNFVTILTNKNIPVKFIPRGGTSFTTGEEITISSKIETPDDFDVACGLALHEASHILLSDFKLLQTLHATLTSKGVIYTPQYRYADDNHLDPVYLIKTFLNVIEDRRIDDYIFRKAPGYRNYYRSMYDKYFYDRVITKALKTNEHTSETVQSYKFRIINIHAPESRLDALNGLQEIYDLIDLSNINRLKTSREALDVAIKVFYVVMDNVMKDRSTDQEEDDTETSVFDIPSQKSDNSGKPIEESNPTPEEDSDSDEDDDEADEEVDGDEDEEVDGDEDEEVELTERQKRIIDKRLEKQEDFVHNDVRKIMIDPKENTTIEIIEETESEIKSIGSDEDFQQSFGTKNVPVVLVKKMTESLVESDSFPLRAGSITRNKLEKAVKEGIRLGTVLARKLQVRSESRDTIYNKQKTGKLDKRMLSSLGYGQSNVFYRKDVDEYNDVNLHMSIDASGSMHRMWEDVMTNAVALAKACSIIPNLEIQISFRTNTRAGSRRRSMPYVLIAYDSRVDSFAKVIKLFPKIDCGNLTPEGLCFEAIENFIVDSNKDTDSIFLNLSDGEPNYSNDQVYYSGWSAASHTLKQVKKMKRRGIKVISYFIEDGYYDSNHSIFDASYGSDAKYIDVTNVHQVSKTMNKVFLEK